MGRPRAAQSSGCASPGVASATGVLEAVAVLVQGMPPDVVALAYVPRVEGGRWARLIESDARVLWADNDSSGMCAVRIARA